jgi:hypothetical protein
MCGYDLLAGVWLRWQIPLLTWEASREAEAASEGVGSAQIADFERLDHNAARRPHGDLHAPRKTAPALDWRSPGKGRRQRTDVRRSARPGAVGES